MEGTVTISITEYENYKKLQEALKKRKVLEGRSWMCSVVYYIPEKTATELYEEEISRLKDELFNEREKRAEVEKNEQLAIKKRLEVEYKKKWWQ